nr:tripartite tricarboxylate transporter TctB family protein [Roseospira goensis]
MPSLGALLAGLGLLLVAAGTPPSPHLSLGPGLAPALVGAGFLGVAPVLARARARAPQPTRARATPGRRTGLALTATLPLLFALLLPTLGMALALPLVLVPLLAWQTRRPLRAVALAFGVTAGLVGLIHGLLRVPVPMGPLSGLTAWL